MNKFFVMVINQNIEMSRVWVSTEQVHVLLHKSDVLRIYRLGNQQVASLNAGDDVVWTDVIEKSWDIL